MSGCCCSKENTCCGSEVIATVSTQLTMKDILGRWKVRWSIGKMNYKVEPGLYAVGKPESTSSVLVSVNYKLAFDSLRKEFSGPDC